MEMSVWQYEDDYMRLIRITDEKCIAISTWLCVLGQCGRQKLTYREIWRRFSHTQAAISLPAILGLKDHLIIVELAWEPTIWLAIGKKALHLWWEWNQSKGTFEWSHPRSLNRFLSLSETQAPSSFLLAVHASVQMSKISFHLNTELNASV